MVVGSVLGITFVLVIVFACYRKKIMKRYHGESLIKGIREEDMDVDLPILDIKTIYMATDDFSYINFLGRGGFGPVYKGKLEDGQEIAVKRLCENSGQGVVEFKNEVKLIAKLQHRNLVRLLGCCIQGEERMLIYEYMPNKSLDFFIFDERRRRELDWKKRSNIIYGIARGLLYLHQDSRLRIIHRDLKAGNVLLDNDMNPKISDFGLAKSFGGDQSESSTNRVVGTYGYMPPEYAIDGHFSVKSDVFSFGVLVLEIITGKTNRGFHHADHDLNLLGHVWKLWVEDRAIEVPEEDLLEETCVVSEILRCIHVALLCVQQKPEDRPNMASVVLMFGSDGSLPDPKQPGFFTNRNVPDVSSSLSRSVNLVSITMIQGR
ncbi:G-type lectin S-receptor-like serine/threonine-protein kinase SD1-1 [Raphanus sativus]|nr:G-type lectin S-receptor-like serine/threonine-protein kinase SD1-1 [Raphanus sativus]